MRRRARIGSAVAAAAGFMAVTPGTAIAGGYGCSGTLVNTWPVKSSVLVSPSIPTPGKFSYYAGPVKIPAKGRCVMIDAITFYYDEIGRQYTGAVACG